MCLLHNSGSFRADADRHARTRDACHLANASRPARHHLRGGLLERPACAADQQTGELVAGDRKGGLNCPVTGARFCDNDDQQIVQLASHIPRPAHLRSDDHPATFRGDFAADSLQMAKRAIIDSIRDCRELATNRGQPVRVVTGSGPVVLEKAPTPTDQPADRGAPA